MEDGFTEHTSKSQEMSRHTDHEGKLSEEKAESNPGVRKSSRHRKQSKRVLDSVDCNDIELLGIPPKKKHRRDLKLKTGHKKDMLPNGRPFKCSLCESSCINNSPTKAKVKKELQPIMKEKFGQLLQLCVKCAIAVNHTENKGPTPEQRAEFEEEGKQFAQHLVEYLNDSAAARLYCSFFQTTKCGCIQCYITGTPANRKRKSSLSGVECATPDTVEPKIDEGVTSIDEKTEQTQRARFLLGLLKESMAKKQTPSSKKSSEKGQQASDDAANLMKESEKFILENRVKLKELGICERGCQKVLCYSNNFLHKKSVGNQPRLQRTKGRAALGRLVALQDLPTMRCCDKICVKMADKSATKVAMWRERSQQGQKEMWKVLEEMLSSTDSEKSNCYKFISMVTGCCLTTVQKVYADVLLSKGTAGCASKREHGMRFHWKRQKELGKSHRGQTVTSLLDQSQVTHPQIISHTPESSDPCFVPTLIVNQVLTSATATTSVMNEITPNPHLLLETYKALRCSPGMAKLQLSGKVVDEKADKEDIKEQFLQLVETIKDPREIANVQQMLAELQRDLKIKQNKENAQQVLSSQASLYGLASSTSLTSSAASTPGLNSSQTPSCSSSVNTGVMPLAASSLHETFVHTSKTGRPFVNIKVHKTAPAELKTSVAQLLQLSSRELGVVTTSSASNDIMHLAQEVDHLAKDDASQVVDVYDTQAEAFSYQLLGQPLVLSNFGTQPVMGTVEPKIGSAASLPLVIGSNTISPLVGTSHASASLVTDNNLDQFSQQVGLFQVMIHPSTESSHLAPQQPQIVSVYPQSAPLQIQPLPLTSSSNPQHIQFQLVSPLIMGQSDLVIPINQTGTMSFILPKQAAGCSQSNETFLHTQPQTCSSSIVPKDSVVYQMSTMQQSFQNIPELPQTLINSSNMPRNKLMPSFPPQTGYNVPFLNNLCNSHYSKQGNTLSSLSSGIHETSEPILNQNLGVHLDQISGSAFSLNDVSSQHQTCRALKTHVSDPGLNFPSKEVLSIEGIQSTGQETEETYQATNIDHYFQSSLLSQISGSIMMGAPSSCSSGSFVFDALADSPVKDSLHLSSPLLQPVPVVTSSLLCEMLMRSVVPTYSSVSSQHLNDFVASSSSSSLLASAAQCQSLVHTTQSVSSIKPSLLISALKSAPTTSAYCQSLNFSTHTTPSAMSTQPVATIGKLEHTSLPATINMGHSASLAHAHINMSRLNRQREPPRVGIVHPHISGVKGGLGHTVSSYPNSSCSQNRNNVHVLPVSSSSMAHVNIMSEPCPSSSSGLISLDSTNLQMAAAFQEPSTNMPGNQLHPQQQHLLLSLLLNSAQAGNITDQSLLSIPHQAANQVNMSTLLTNPGASITNLASLNENIFQSTDAGSHNKTITGSGHAGSQNPAAVQGLHIATSDSSNFSPDQTSLPKGNQNIVLGAVNNQPQAGVSHFFQSVVCPNTGHVKLIPVILSDANGNASGLNIFPQSGQLLLNMGPCSGLDSVSSLSPQNLNRDNGVLLDMSPSSNQNIPLQHPLLQIGGNAQSTAAAPLPFTNNENIHQSVEVTPVSKGHTQPMQASITPFENRLGNTLTLAQPKSHPYSNLTSDTTSEARNTNNIERHLSTSTYSGGAVSGTVHASTHHSGQSYTLSSQPNTTISAQHLLGKDTQNYQSNFRSEENSHIGHYMFASASCNLAKDGANSEGSNRSVELTGTSSSSLPTSTLMTKTKNSDFAQMKYSSSQNTIESPDNHDDEKEQVSTLQTVNIDHHTSQSSTQSVIQLPHQMPFQVLNMVYPQEGQTDSDRVLSSAMDGNILGQQDFQNTELGQQIQPVLNISSSNQIFLPVQSIPFNRHLGFNQPMSNITQGLHLGQQLSDLRKILLPAPGSAAANEPAPLASVAQGTKNVSTPSTCTSLQSATASSGSQQTNIVQSCPSVNKHRPIRPKLLPVPTPAPKVSLMLVPHKPGYPAYQLTQLDQPILSFQHVSEQKDRALPQIQMASQEPLNSSSPPVTTGQQLQNTFLVSGTSHPQLKSIVVPDTSQHLHNAVLVPGNNQQAQNTILVPGNNQQSQNTALVSGNNRQSQNTNFAPGNNQQAHNTNLVPGNNQQSQNTILVPGNNQQAQNTNFVLGNIQQSQNTILVPGSNQQAQNTNLVSENNQQAQNTNFIPGNNQLSHDTILIPGNNQQAQNTILALGNNQQTQNTISVPGNSHELQNTVVVARNCQKQQTAVKVSGTFEQENPLGPTLDVTTPAQPPTMSAQILLVSQAHTMQGTQNTETHSIFRKQNEPLQLFSQHTNDTGIQTLPVGAMGGQSVSQKSIVQEICSQQSVVLQASPSQTSVLFDTPEAFLLQSGTLTINPAQNAPCQIISSQNKGYQVGVFPNGSVFVDSPQGDAFPAEALHGIDVCNLQSNGCEPGILQFGSVEFNVSESGGSQTTSQLSSLPSGSLHILPMQPAVQSDIQRLNPQVASQLSGRHGQMITLKKPVQQLMTSSPGSPIVKTAQVELKGNQLQAMKGHGTRFDTASSSLAEPPSSFLSKFISEGISPLPAEDKGLGKVALNITQSTSHLTSSTSFAIQTLDMQQASGCSNIKASLLSDLPFSTSDGSAPTNQILHRLTQPSALAVGMRNSTTNEDTKPVIEPVQYLQCREVIDLTDDSPPLTPSSSVQNKSKVLGLNPIQRDLPQSSVLNEDLQKHFFPETRMPSQQSTRLIPLQPQNPYQENQTTENQHLQQRLDQMKQEADNTYKVPNEIVLERLNYRSNHPVVCSSKKGESSNLLILEEISEEMRQVLIASLEAHAAGSPDVQLVSRTFTPSDDLSYQGFLSSKGSSQQTEDQFNVITKAISNNKCPSAVVTISTNQRFQQSLARAKSHVPSLAMMSVVPDSKLNELTAVKEDDIRLSQTACKSSSDNMSPKLPSLSVGTSINLKQLLEMTLTAQGQSRSSSTTSLSSETSSILPSDQGSSSVATASSVLSGRKSSVASSCSSLSLTTLAPVLPSSPAVRASTGRLVIHPLTSSTVAFVRTTNTPTDAVGPPNITIMSPAQANSSPLLRFHHESGSVSAATAVINQQAIVSVCPKPLSKMNKTHNSGFLKLINSTNSASVQARMQGAQDAKNSVLSLCPASGGTDQASGQSARRLSLENASQTSGLNEAQTSETFTPSFTSRSVDSMIKSRETPLPSKSKPRKRPSTIMDLLKSKEKLQATAASISSGVPLNSSPGPVTLMISGAAGSPNLLVMDSSSGQSRVDSNALNITVKNLQLIGKLSNNIEDTNLASKIMPATIQPSGFTILHPNVLHTSVPKVSNAVSTSQHCSSAAVVEQRPTVALLSMPSMSHIDSQTKVCKTSSMPHNISLASQKVTITCGNTFLGNLSQPKVLPGHQGAYNQPVSLTSSAGHSRHGNQGTDVPASIKGHSTMNETSPQIVLTQDPELKRKRVQEILKSDPEVQFQLIGQPQVVSSSFKGNSTAGDSLGQNPQTTLTESSNGDKLKFKLTSAKNVGSEDWHHDTGCRKFQLLEESHRKQLGQGTGAVKKLLLLNDKLSGVEDSNIQSSTSLRPAAQTSCNPGQITTEQKQLSLKSPQLLQLMKHKQPFTHIASDQPGSHEQSLQLKLPSSSIIMPTPDDSFLYNSRPSSAAQQVSCHQPKKQSQQRDQLPTFQTQPAAIPLLQAKGNKDGLVEVDSKFIGEANSDTRRNLLPSQNPLLANILFTSFSGSTPSHSSSIVSVSKSPLYCENQSKAPVERSISIENQQDSDNITPFCQTSAEQLDMPHLGNKRERHLKRGFEAEHKAASDHKGVSTKAQPAYGQPSRYEGSTKDMTRVNRVIEDIYKFSDEGDETTPPPAFGALKSQAVSQKCSFLHTGQRKAFDSLHDQGSSSLSQSPENMAHSSLSKSNIKPLSNTAQYASLHSTGLQTGKSYPSAHVSESIPPQIWRNIKKLKLKKDHAKLSSKLSLKKVQFSDVVTSKSAAVYGQSMTVSSHIDAVTSEVPSDYVQDAHVTTRSPQDLAGIQYPLEFTNYLPGKHQNLVDDRQDSHVISGRHSYLMDQLQADARESKLRVCHSAQIEAPFTRPDTALVNTKDTAGKTSELTYIQRDKDGLSSSDFDLGDKHGRDAHRIVLYQHFPKANLRSLATSLADYEQVSDPRGEEDTGPVQTFRHMDDNQYTFLYGFVQGNMDNLSSAVGDKAEALHTHNFQTALRSSDQTVLMEAFGDINSQSEDMLPSKTEGSNRDIPKKRQLMHDESFLFSTPSNHEMHMADRKHYIADKKELMLPSPDNVTGISDRDSAFDQQSSFNILSTQGYSKLSRQRLNRTHCDQSSVEDFAPSISKSANFTNHSLSTNNTSCTSEQFLEVQTRSDPLSTSNVSSMENLERQPSESPLIRQKILKTNFELARQMKKECFHIVNESRPEASEGRKLESPQKFISYADRKPDGISNRDTECQGNKEMDYRALSGPVTKLTSPIFLDSLDGRPDVLSSLESYSCLRKEIKDLKGENHYLKLEVAKAEQKEKEQQRQRHLSSSDKQKSILNEIDKVEKIYYPSPSSTSSQTHAGESDNGLLPRIRHPSSTAALGILNCSPLPGSEQFRPDEGFQNKFCHQSLISCGIQQILESDISYADASLRGNVSGLLYARSINNIDDCSPPESYFRDTRDPFVSSSMSGHSRPNSQLELGIPQYESVRHRYPSSETKPLLLRGIPEGDGFAPFQEHTRHRNLSSSLGLRALPDVDPPPYDMSQRQRNPSTSSLKSTFQDVDLSSLELGARSRNPSSSSWVRYWDYGNDSSFAVVRSRNPSGSSNRRSRPGSSSSDRELPVIMDELPMFSEIARTRSRNSSGESIEPTLEFFLDPQQFIQYTHPPTENHIKRTKH